MPDYREQNQEAKTWRRAAGVVISNPLPGQGVCGISFHEHDVVQIGGRVLSAPVQDAGPAGLVVPFEPDRVIKLLHPDTGEELGEMTHAQVYVALYSVYIDAATRRDEARQRAIQEAMRQSTPSPSPSEPTPESSGAQS